MKPGCNPGWRSTPSSFTTRPSSLPEVCFCQEAANLFRRYGLSDTLRGVAEKAQLGQDSLPHNWQVDSLLAYFAPRAYPPPDKYVHPAWSHVNQPVLAMWGQLDQHVPVGESVAG